MTPARKPTRSAVSVPAGRSESTSEYHSTARIQQMTDRDLIAEGRALLQAAEWDPTYERLAIRDGALWLLHPDGTGDGLTLEMPSWARAHAALIVWAVNSAPWLLDRVAELEARNG